MTSMTIAQPSSQTTAYLQYLEQVCPALSSEHRAALQHSADQTDWDTPGSGLECNNIGVMALIEAEQSPDLSIRAFYLNLAVEALQAGADDDPLCRVHLAILHSLVGDHQQAMQLAFGTIIALLPPPGPQAPLPLGLIYIPVAWGVADQTAIGDSPCWTATSSPAQAAALASEVLWRSQPVFYNPSGQRFLQLAAHMTPQSVAVNLRLGIASLMSRRLDGLIYLHDAMTQQPDCLPVLQALHLAYRAQGNALMAAQWHTQAQQAQASPAASDAVWTTLAPDHPYTYAQLEPGVAIAVEPSFQSIVTSTLVATGDWFEREMEFWRQWLQPGMTVIDVGANVGVYTFSAARQVGSQGRVIAIEPFSGCVQCLEATCTLNQFDWVTVVAGAASNREGTITLAVGAASELNEVVAAGQKAPANAEEVACVTLDGVCDREHLQRVDCLKIDAEGHELQVLQGSEQLLAKFAPVILYENIAGSQGSNLDVTQYLRSKGYTICRYQPFLQAHIPVETDEEIQGCLNLIAWPPTQ